jgi:hypothetical protein
MREPTRPGSRVNPVAPGIEKNYRKFDAIFTTDESPDKGMSRQCFRGIDSPHLWRIDRYNWNRDEQLRP